MLRLTVGVETFKSNPLTTQLSSHAIFSRFETIICILVQSQQHAVMAIEYLVTHSILLHITFYGKPL